MPAQPDNQEIAAEKGGLAPTRGRALRRPGDQEGVSRFADLLGESIATASPRPVSPAYSDISLAIQKTLHPPPAIEPEKTIEELRSTISTGRSKGGLF